MQFLVGYNAILPDSIYSSYISFGKRERDKTKTETETDNRLNLAIAMYNFSFTISSHYTLIIDDIHRMGSKSMAPIDDH
jgi:hypothetical protein